MKIDFRYIREMTLLFSVTNFLMILLIRFAYSQIAFGELIITALFADLFGMYIMRPTNAA